MSSTQTFVVPERVLDRFRAVLPEDAVHTEQADRDQYRDPFWPTDDRTYDSSAILYPTTTEQVQEIVRIASEEGVPVWTSSQGRNNGYGGPSPRVAGSVLISFRRMNKVLEVNRELAYAVVQPGVRWFDLYDALQETGNGDLMISIPDIGWGSVVGNSLDNGITYLPYGQDFQSPCGMEVVLGNGELLRTGMGAMPGNKSWHLYKRGLGPTFDAMFTQSNYGIVTRMGYWLMRRPEAMAPIQLRAPREDQLGQAIDIIRELRLDGSLRGTPSMFNIISMAWQHRELGEYLGGKGRVEEAELQRLADSSGYGRWLVRAAAWGSREVVESQVRHIQQAWEAIEGGSSHVEKIFTRDDWGPFESFSSKVHSGTPTMDMLDALPKNIGHIGFSPVVPLVGEQVVEVINLMRTFMEDVLGDNLSIGALSTNERTITIICNINLVLDDEAQLRKSYDAARRMVEEFGRLGYGEYRAHIDFMDVASDQYSFNDHSYRRFAETIKDAVDPAGILSPGRHGIWPERFRPERKSAGSDQ